MPITSEWIDGGGYPCDNCVGTFRAIGVSKTLWGFAQGCETDP